jgi:hypothetical protein
MCLTTMSNMENKLAEVHNLLLVRTVMTKVEILRLEDE